jgi:hypothetical protein
MNDKKTPTPGEMKYPMESEVAKHPNSPAANGAAPPEIPKPDSEGYPTDEVQHQWVGRKGPAQAGKP